MPVKDNDSPPPRPEQGPLRRFAIRREELTLVAWSSAYFFFILSSYYCIRPVRDAFGLSGGDQELRWLFRTTLLAMIILSWIAPGSNQPAVYLLHQITEPVMAPFRKVLPAMGGMDFSPILLFIVINIIQIALRHMAAGVGLHPALVIGL